LVDNNDELDTLESKFDRSSTTIAPKEPDTLRNIRGVVDAVFGTDEGGVGGMRLRMVGKPMQIVPLARLYLYAEKFKSPTAANLARYLTELSVGQAGRGRKDMTDSLKAILTGLNQQEPESPNRSLMSRLLGR
jgi:hypothetical protein